MIHNIELKPGRGGQLMRAAGGYGQLIQKFEQNGLTRVKLVSGEHRLFQVTVGQQLGYYQTLITQIKNWERLVEKDG